jgi:hypothetical protein
MTAAVAKMAARNRPLLIIENSLPSDAVAGLSVGPVERDLFGLRRGRIQRDGTGDERKAQEAFPVGARGHTQTPFRGGWDLRRSSGHGSDTSGVLDTILLNLSGDAREIRGRRLNLLEQRKNIGACRRARNLCARSRWSRDC